MCRIDLNLAEESSASSLFSPAALADEQPEETDAADADVHDADRQLNPAGVLGGPVG
ncbi:exported hypothetical protein [Agrobacterium fabacearum S56]|nr:exported hypothetical protein [Agrobacterium fabacearum S56]